MVVMCGDCGDGGRGFRGRRAGVFYGGGGVEGLVWMETGYVLYMCEIKKNNEKLRQSEE